MDFPASRLPESRLPEILVLILILFVTVKAQPFNSQNNSMSSQDGVTNFQPSLAVVVGILCIMFALTFILLIYAKCCHQSASALFTRDLSQGGLPDQSRFSGIDKTVIESLPFFRFSALKGTREGLECAVCLSKFEDIEILRLLPKCRHAFHIDCVDQWLEKHSSCPLCRHNVSEDDVTTLTYSNSLRFLRNQSELLREDSNLEIFVQREESSRFGSGRSFISRRFEKGKKEEELPIHQESGESDEILHKFNHKIIVSDAVLKNRWSSVSSSDLMFLKSEMINSVSSNRFSNSGKLAMAKVIEDGEVIKIKEEMERKREFESKISQTEIFPFPSDSSTRGNSGFSSKELTRSNDKRSMSEIVVHSRFTEFSMENSSSNRESQDRQRRLWLPIARRTIQWFANRERRPTQSKNTRESLDV